MTPGQIQGSIEEICDGLAQHRNEMIMASGGDHTDRAFDIGFDPREVTYEEMTRILTAVRERFPQWHIKGHWK